MKRGGRRILLLLFTAVVLLTESRVVNGEDVTPRANDTPPDGTFITNIEYREDKIYSLRIFLKDDGRIIDVDFQVDAKEIEALERDAVNALFAFYDRNHDEQLSALEARYLPHPMVFEQQLSSPLSPALAQRTLDAEQDFNSEQLFAWYKRQGLTSVHIGWGMDQAAADLDQRMQHIRMQVTVHDDNAARQRDAAQRFEDLDSNRDGLLSAHELHRDLSYPSTSASVRLPHTTSLLAVSSSEAALRSADDGWLQMLPAKEAVGVEPCAYRIAIPDFDNAQHWVTSGITEFQEFAGNARVALLARMDGGRLELEIARARRDTDRRAKEADTNEDGVLEAAELAEKSARLLRNLLPQADGDGDGGLTKQEIEQWCDLWEFLARSQLVISIVGQEVGNWERADSNVDGKLSEAEWLFGVTNRSSAQASPAEDSMLAPRRLRITISRGKPLSLLNVTRSRGPAWFQAADTNADSFLHRREFVGPLQSFDRLDGNSDGLISSDEAAASNQW